ncbi:MAG: hypothetical protein ACRD4T_00130 [Candidatus Acidiferrales bacterium]
MTDLGIEELRRKLDALEERVREGEVRAVRTERLVLDLQIEQRIALAGVNNKLEQIRTLLLAEPDETIE